MTSLIHSRGLPAGVIAIGFALAARVIGAVTDGGAVVGALMAFCLMLGAGLLGFVPLLVVFVLTLVTTHWGYTRKQRLGVAERKRGRTAWQVLANLSAAALCALPVIWFPHSSDILLVAATAALAEAAADTVSSEVGQATADRAYIITNFHQVPIGTNGAISLEGTLSGCIAAAAVGWGSAIGGVVSWQRTPLIAISGIAGMFLDSVLGATWENSGKLENDAVNFVSTVFAADLALGAAIVLGKMAS